MVVDNHKWMWPRLGQVPAFQSHVAAGGRLCSSASGRAQGVPQAAERSGKRAAAGGAVWGWEVGHLTITTGQTCDSM